MGRPPRGSHPQRPSGNVSGWATLTVQLCTEAWSTRDFLNKECNTFFIMIIYIKSCCYLFKHLINQRHYMINTGFPRRQKTWVFRISITTALNCKFSEVSIPSLNHLCPPHSDTTDLCNDSWINFFLLPVLCLSAQMKMKDKTLTP